MLDQIRAAVAKRLPDRREGAALRISRQLFRTRWSQTTDDQKATINAWCSRWSVLAGAYWTKERYCDLYLCGSPAEAEAYYKDWIATLPPTVSLAFKTKCAIPRRWMPMVLAYFEEPHTTGYVEAVNRVLDDMQRAGRGYSFEVIRAKLMLAEKLEKRIFRGKNDVTKIGVPTVQETAPDGEPIFMRIDGGETMFPSTRFGIDLDKLRAVLSEVSPNIVYGAKGTRVGDGISTLWPRFMTGPS